MTESTLPLTNAGQAVISAVAHQIERMSKEEVQALAAKALLDVQNENAALTARVAELEKENTRLMWQCSRSLFNVKDYENFDPSEYTVPLEEVLEALDQIKE